MPRLTIALPPFVPTTFVAQLPPPRKHNPPPPGGESSGGGTPPPDPDAPLELD